MSKTLDELTEYINTRNYDLTKVGSFKISPDLRKQIEAGQQQLMTEKADFQYFNGIPWEESPPVSYMPDWIHDWYGELVAYRIDGDTVIVIDVEAALASVARMAETRLSRGSGQGQ